MKLSLSLSKLETEKKCRFFSGTCILQENFRNLLKYELNMNNLRVNLFCSVQVHAEQQMP